MTDIPDTAAETLPMVRFWYGQDIRSLGHAELLAAFNELADLYTNSEKTLREHGKRYRQLLGMGRMDADE